MATTKYKVTRVAGVSDVNTSNIRQTGGASLGLKIGEFRNGQVGYGTEELGGPDQAFWCLKLSEGTASPFGWVYARWNNNPTFIQFEAVGEVEPPVPTENTVVEFSLPDESIEMYVTPPSGVRVKVYPPQA